MIGLLSSDYQPIITSTNKMAASCWRAFDEIIFFRVFAMLFLFVFGIITCEFIPKQLLPYNPVNHKALSLTRQKKVIVHDYLSYKLLLGASFNFSWGDLCQAQTTSSQQLDKMCCSECHRSRSRGRSMWRILLDVSFLCFSLLLFCFFLCLLACLFVCFLLLIGFFSWLAGKFCLFFIV